jgi:hypothetical protein
MKNRDYIIKRLEKLEGTFATLRYMVNTAQPISDFKMRIEEGIEEIEEIKSAIDNEPTTPNEVNRR